MSLSRDSQEERSQTLWITLSLLLATLGLRVAAIGGLVPDHWMNFSPVMALAFAGSLLMPKFWPSWSWVVVLLGVDLLCRGSQVLNYNGGHYEILACYFCYMIAAMFGKFLHGRVGLVGGIFGALGCSVLFYVVSNSVAWLIEPYYAKSLTGWIQALTLGTPGPYPSTLHFFRNSLVADLSGVVTLFAVAHSEALLRGYRMKRFKLQRI